MCKSNPVPRYEYTGEIRNTECSRMRCCCSWSHHKADRSSAYEYIAYHVVRNITRYRVYSKHERPVLQLKKATPGTHQYRHHRHRCSSRSRIAQSSHPSLANPEPTHLSDMTTDCNRSPAGLSPHCRHSCLALCSVARNTPIIATWCSQTRVDSAAEVKRRRTPSGRLLEANYVTRTSQVAR